MASDAANSFTVSPISENSPIVRLRSEVTFTRIPLAPERLTSSNSGLEIAASAASLALPSPDDTPEPIIAIPISDMTVLTSAKSTFIVPGVVINSAIP